jgi:hypothetical protein
VVKFGKDPIYRTKVMWKQPLSKILFIVMVTLTFDLMTPKLIGVFPWRPHRFPHNNFSSVYQIFTRFGHMISLCKVIRSKVKVTFTINIIFDIIVSVR